MEIETILERLSDFDNGRFPEQSLEQAIVHQETITPRLLEILAAAKEAPEDFIDSGSMAPIYALFLLAQFREPRAYPLVVDLVSLPEDVVDHLMGDAVTEDLGRILASVCDSDLTLICRMIENEDAGEYVRGAGFTALVSLVVNDRIDRGRVLAIFSGLFHGKLTRSESHVWEALVSACAKLGLVELRDEIDQAYAEGLVWPGYISPEDVAESFAQGQDALLRDPSLAFVEDTIRELSWWACFKQPKRRGKAKVRRAAGPGPAPGASAVTAPRKVEKIGRNQPCPCGSGKKYKKCCGART